MQIAFLEAERAERENPEPFVADFEKLDTTSKNAERSLQKLIHHLMPNAQCAEDLETSIVTAQAGIQSGDLREIYAQAKKDAQVLWAAREIAKRLAETAPRKAARLRKGRHNPGKPKLRAFLAPLAEGWIFMTGKRPGKSIVHDDNPFLRFAQIAWLDVYDPKNRAQTVDFIGALKSLPVLTDDKFKKVAAEGPDWI